MGYKHVWYPELKRRSLASAKTTRSHDDEDAHRDMDGFNVNAEHHAFRVALAHGKWRLAAELAANIDENVERGGPMPDAWSYNDAFRRAKAKQAMRAATKAHIKKYKGTP